MKELGAVFIVGAILILAINILGYIAVTYGNMAFWIALAILMIFLVQLLYLYITMKIRLAKKIMKQQSMV